MKAGKERKKKMSFWSYVRGMIEVYPMGRTQAEMRYILETVLSHLPPVTGSEGNMKAHIVQKSGFNYSSSADEFGQDTGMGNSHYGRFLIHNHVTFWLLKVI